MPDYPLVINQYLSHPETFPFDPFHIKFPLSETANKFIHPFQLAAPFSPHNRERRFVASIFGEGIRPVFQKQLHQLRIRHESRHVQRRILIRTIGRIDVSFFLQ